MALWWGGIVARLVHGGLASWWGSCTVDWHGRTGWGKQICMWKRSWLVCGEAVGTCKASGVGHWGGDYVVERWGFEDPACGVKSLCNIDQKRNEKKKKRNKHIITCMPTNEAMVVAGLARLEGQGTVERWGFEGPAYGEKRSLQWSEKK